MKENTLRSVLNYKMEIILYVAIYPISLKNRFPVICTILE